mmetsp:Transcript_11209/g.14650  ORF Transcript_11209/g.14650 Transcript_11209/m.14650 type:complete len:544 (+) Transcript_11209:615-2246(+)
MKDRVPESDNLCPIRVGSSIKSRIRTSPTTIRRERERYADLKKLTLRLIKNIEESNDDEKSKLGFSRSETPLKIKLIAAEAKKALSLSENAQANHFRHGRRSKPSSLSTGNTKCSQTSSFYSAVEVLDDAETLSTSSFSKYFCSNEHLSKHDYGKTTTLSWCFLLPFLPFLLIYSSVRQMLELCWLYTKSFVKRTSSYIVEVCCLKEYICSDDEGTTISSSEVEKSIDFESDFVDNLVYIDHAVERLLSNVNSWKGRRTNCVSKLFPLAKSISQVNKCDHIFVEVFAKILQEVEKTFYCCQSDLEEKESNIRASEYRLHLYFGELVNLRGHNTFLLNRVARLQDENEKLKKNDDRERNAKVLYQERARKAEHYIQVIRKTSAEICAQTNTLLLKKENQLTDAQQDVNNYRSQVEHLEQELDSLVNLLYGCEGKLMGYEEKSSNCTCGAFGQFMCSNPVEDYSEKQPFEVTCENPTDLIVSSRPMRLEAMNCPADTSIDFTLGEEARLLTLECKEDIDYFEKLGEESEQEQMRVQAELEVSYNN